MKIYQKKLINDFKLYPLSFCGINRSFNDCMKQMRLKLRIKIIKNGGKEILLIKNVRKKYNPGWMMDGWVDE